MVTRGGVILGVCKAMTRTPHDDLQQRTTNEVEDKKDSQI
jgi:hypothetical protein